MPIVRIAWYASPTATGESTYLVGPPLGAQCFVGPSHWEHSLDAWLEQVLALTGFVITSANFRVIRYTTDQGQT